MLNIIRESAKSIISKVLIWFVAFTFVGAAFLVWGQGGSRRDDVMATVGDFVITKANHHEQTRMYEEQLRLQFRNERPEDLYKNFNPPKMALDALLNKAVQKMAAKEAGLLVTDTEIRKSIFTMPQFQSNGVFDKQLYNRMLSYNMISPKTFEEILKGDLLVNKFRRMIVETVGISDAEVVEWHLSQNQKVVLDYVKIESSNYERKVKVLEEALTEWYEKRLLEFETPEKRDFKVATFAPVKFAPSVKVDDEDLDTFYENNKLEFSKPESVRASHILILIPESASDREGELAKEKVDKAMARLEAGESFFEVAKDVSEGPSAAKGGDLGEFTRGQMVQGFEDVAFNLKIGDFSKPFRTEFGWHIIKLFAHNEAREKQLEEVRDLIEKRIRIIKASEAALNAADAISEKMYGSNLEELVKRDDRIQLRTGQAVDGMVIKGFDDWSSVWQTLSELEPGFHSEPQKLNEAYVIFVLDKVIPVKTGSLNENRMVAEKRFRMQNATELAHQDAEKIFSAGTDGFKAQANSLSLKILHTKPFSKASLMKPGSEKSVEAMLTMGLDLALDEVAIVPYSLGFYVIHLKERKPLDLKDIVVSLPTIRENLLKTKANQIYTDYIGNLRKKAERDGRIIVYVDYSRL
tara:strand:- start:327591 stop:329498 length:1908 start_codon:yes stop_codon:yes gene_type:complete